MIVIRTSRPLRKVFLKNGEEVRAFDDEFQEEDFSNIASYRTAPVPDEAAVNRLAEERLAAAHAEWEAKSEQMRLEALEEGRLLGEQQAEARLAEKKKVFQELIEALTGQREKVLHESENVATTLAMIIARRFVGAAAEATSDVIKQSIKSALRLVTEKDKLVLRVNPEDLEEVREHQDDIIFIGAGIGKLDIRPDKLVRRGGCIVETDTGNIDARVETRLAEMEKALKQAWYTGINEEGQADAAGPAENG